MKSLLVHPRLRDLDIDDPRTTERRREVIRSNRFLWRIYDEWYRLIAEHIPPGEGRVVEIGSGAGFMSEYVPGLIGTEVFPCHAADLVADARRLPFGVESLKAIAMVDVLHHVPDTRLFLREAQRCLRPGGAIVMVEPWVSTWSRLIYGHLHHEPFEPSAQSWTFPEAGPLSGANGALPWIIFQRDRPTFQTEFPELLIREIRPFMPLRYLVSGGVSMRQLMPHFLYPVWRELEGLLDAWPGTWPMFAFIHLDRR